MVRTYDRLTQNVSPVNVRREKFEGKDYVVVPTVMIAEGVWEGSQGPLLYLNSEFAKFPQTWNHKPATSYHPTLDGEGISGCDPAVLEAQKCGLVFNTSSDGSRLKCETWLDEVKTKALCPDVIPRLDAGQSVEVSTGLYREVEETAGVWNGKPYVGIVRNIQPDHLAILPTGRGAYSVSDGGGLLRNAASPKGDANSLSYNDVREQVRALLKPAPTPNGEYLSDYCYVCDVFPKYVVYEQGDKTWKVGYKVKDSKVSLAGDPEEVRKVTSYITANGELIVNTPDAAVRRQKLVAALSSLPEANPTGFAFTAERLRQMTADSVVWESDNKLFRLPYTYAEDKITFVGQPAEVVKLDSYHPATSAGRTQQEPPVTTPNTLQSTQPPPVPTANTVPSAPALDRPGTITALIQSGRFAETDRGFLDGLNDTILAKIGSPPAEVARTPVAVLAPLAGVQNQQQPPAAIPVVNQQPVLTTEQFLAIMPPQIKRMVTNAQQVEAREKARLINAIVANQNNRFNKAWLELQDNDMLAGIAALSTPAAGIPNYGGQGEVSMFITDNQLVDNAADDPALPLPSMADDFKRDAG